VSALPDSCIQLFRTGLPKHDVVILSRESGAGQAGSRIPE